jgi:signal transduction histidine kinase
MKRPWQVWLVFVVCVLGGAAAMAWLTQQALRTDELRRAAEAERELEQRVSLALWRMDTVLAPIIAEEVIRPPSAFRPRADIAANSPPQPIGGQQQEAVQRPVQKSEQEAVTPQIAQSQDFLPPVLPNDSGRPTDAQRQQAVQAPAEPPRQGAAAPQLLRLPASPPPDYVLLQFEVGPDGIWHSPQTPSAQSSMRLQDLAVACDVPALVAELPSTSLPTVADVGRNSEAAKMAQSLEEFNSLENQLNFFQGNRKNILPLSPGGDSTNQLAEGTVKLGKGKVPSQAADFEERNLRYQSAAQQSLLSQAGARGINAQFDEAAFGGDGATRMQPNEQIGVSRPVWVGDRLLLARRVGWNGQSVVQGSWLDWPRLKTRLLAETVNLLPDADLVPVPEDANIDPSRMLAGLPVRLVVGPDSMASMAGTLSPALRWALWMGWGAVALATAAAAALLAGVMALSERRAAFVSSVTHELRTPLTTFRMYAEMLARGMVPDAQRRQEYFDTLQREAERLTLLVENVLAYARLERGRKPQTIDRVTVGNLLERVGPRLAQRAAQADMLYDMQLHSDAESRVLKTDSNVVEQILFNLVDNSAKYAHHATDRRIHVFAGSNGQWIQLAVSDHGPGIDGQRLSGRMRPFGKSAEESAETAPGVGLGLALCRRLARQLGGRLDVAATPGGGATVTLALPM